jgi:hypothetical protein
LLVPETQTTLKDIDIDVPDATAGMIRFENIKGSIADRLAKLVYDGEVKLDRLIRYAEIERLLRE